MQNRYYNPEWGRFISFDNYGGTVGEILSHNGYAYCKNNPINMVDENGNIGLLTATIFAIVVVAIMITTIEPQTWTDLGSTIAETVTTIGNTISSAVSSIVTSKKTNTQTVAKTTIKTTTKNKDKEKHNYWQAELIGGDVHIGRPISYEEASLRVRMNQNIMCKNQTMALQIAQQYPEYKLDFNKNQIPGRSYYLHYHINGKHGAPHIWFYSN